MESVVIVRAPVCLNLAGSLDTEAFRSGSFCSAAITAAISYYVYAILSTSQLEGVQVTFDGGQFFSHCSLAEYPQSCRELDLLGAIVRHFNIQDGQRIFLASQVPVHSGLNVRGSLAMSMIKALAFKCGLDLDPDALVELATQINAQEDESLSSLQDPYGAARGGLWWVDYSSSKVAARPLELPTRSMAALEQGLLLFARIPVQTLDGESVGRPRLSLGSSGTSQMRELILSVRHELERGDMEAFGRLMHRCWVDDGQAFGIEPLLDQCYQTALDCGALGGKAIGDDQEGFLLLYCPPAYQPSVIKALTEMGMQQWPLSLDREGVQVMQVMPWSWAGPMSTMPQAQYPMSR
jgi:D-glycero-alpha-D-manno-heptose-7-phosphate kinase